MANIVGAIATSHTPTIGFAFDKNKQDDPVWAPIFEALRAVQQWLARRRSPTCCSSSTTITSRRSSSTTTRRSRSASASAYAVADEGGGPRELPPSPATRRWRSTSARSLVADEFDMSFFQDRALDHGVLLAAVDAVPHEPDWPAPIVPLQVGVLQFPMPSARRCYKLGQALRRAIESYPEDLKVVIVATGGLSHQVHGERAGFNNTAWDAQFLDLIEKRPGAADRDDPCRVRRLGGIEGAEVIMWLVMRGALSAKVQQVHQTYYLPSMTGIATAIYENDAIAPSPADSRATAPARASASSWPASSSWRAPIRSRSSAA